jgi:hypothetical protein
MKYSFTGIYRAARCGDHADLLRNLTIIPRLGVYPGCIDASNENGGNILGKLRKLSVIASMGALAIINTEVGNAASPPAFAQILRAKQEFDGWWEFKTIVSPAPIAPGSQGLPAEPPDLEGNTMLGRMALLYTIQQAGGSLIGTYHNVRERREDDNEKEKAGAVSGVVRNREAANSQTEESKPDQGQPGDPAAAAAAAAAALKKLGNDVVMVVIVDIPDEDEDIVLRYRGTQLRTDMTGTVEFGMRNKDGKFEKAGDGTFVARKMY